MIEQFAKSVDIGLSKPEKTLPSKYFYDKNGDALFVEIMNMPEYYLTRCEMEIFSTQTAALIESFQADKNTYFELIELGAGDGTKTSKLLEALSTEGYQFDYLPVDISKNSLDQLQTSLEQSLPDVSVIPKHGDYFEMLGSISDYASIYLMHWNRNRIGTNFWCIIAALFFNTIALRTKDFILRCELAGRKRP